MLTLTLFRHAKSSWDHSGLTDFDRPLNARGERDAPVMGRYLADQGLIPDLILCSTAKRTRDTLELASAQWPEPPKTEFSETLYLASEDAMLAVLQGVPDGPRHVMMIGHNPGIHSFAVSLTGSGAPEARFALAAKYPTAAIANITFDDAEWSDIGSGQGRLAFFIAPKQISCE